MLAVIFCLFMYQVTNQSEQSSTQSNIFEKDYFMESITGELSKFQTSKFVEFGETKKSSARRSRNLLQQHDAVKIDGCNYSSADRECLDGYFPPIQTELMLNGITVESKEYPFFVSLQEERFHRGRFVQNCFTHICGGSLIQDDVVVTAAHCIKDYADITKAHLQEVTKKLKVVRESKCRHQKGVEELIVGWIIVHPGYQDGVEGSISTYQDDIALLFLRGKMRQKDALINFQDADIFEQQAEASGVLSIGFGMTSLQRSTEVWSTTLKEILTSLRPKPNCVYRLQEENQVSDWNQIYKDDKMLCAYDISRVATCMGDSGGPMFIQAKNGQYILLGITSWSLTSQCKSNLVQQPPDIFTRVSFYKQWMLDNIKAYSGSGVGGLLTFSEMSEAEALMAFKNALFPEYDDTFEDWNYSIDHCQWSFITCEANAAVEINMDGERLTGQLAKELSVLKRLRKFDIGVRTQQVYRGSYTVYNYLTGSLPKELSEWTELEIFSIDVNNFRGYFPQEYSVWTNMQIFHAMSNNFIGSLPLEYSAWRNVSEFSVYNNEITGKLPPEYSLFSNVELVSVAKNELTGSLPPEYSTFSGLTMFLVDNNQFTGSLPEQYSSWKKFEVIGVSANQLTGQLPSQYSTWENLESFNVSVNQFTGELPLEFSNFADVTYFEVMENQLSGKLPKEYSVFTSIWNFHLTYNQFTGGVPIEYSDITSNGRDYKIEYDPQNN